MIGYKRGRFTGGIDSSGWVKENPREMGGSYKTLQME